LSSGHDHFVFNRPDNLATSSDELLDEPVWDDEDRHRLLGILTQSETAAGHSHGRDQKPIGRQLPVRVDEQ
jgi:hypothetical protein